MDKAVMSDPGLWKHERCTAGDYQSCGRYRVDSSTSDGRLNSFLHGFCVWTCILYRNERRSFDIKGMTNEVPRRVSFSRCSVIGWMALAAITKVGGFSQNLLCMQVVNSLNPTRTDRSHEFNGHGLGQPPSRWRVGRLAGLVDMAT